MFNGIPIPFTAFIRPDGTPDFKVTDQRSWAVCASREQCGLCGQKLVPKEFCFIGGPGSCASGCFYDPPMHRECAEYAFKVCPFLACQKGYSKGPAPEYAGATVVTDPNIVRQRPDKMGILFCKGFHLIEMNGGHYFKADEIEAIEWKD